MKIVTLPVSDLHPADYNPRKDLAPGDKQYEKLARSIETFGYVEPIVWNRTTGNIVGGHQRLKVLVQKGYTEVQVVEVELNEQEERILNVSLNKISGRWDNEKLTAILDELKEQDEMALTGFEDWELDALKVTYDHIEDLLNEDFSDTGKSEPNSYTMTFTLPEEVHEAMDKYIDENPAGKVELAAQENSFIVQYGINIIGYGDTLLTAVAAQTENLPDDIENLVMTCGSGITATGVMIGLHRYGKRVKRMHLVATAPDRRGFIHETLKKYGADREFEYHDLFHSPGFVYEKSAVATWGGIRLHPHYEAKTMQWFRSSGIAPESTLFWITGAEPRSPGQS